MSSPIPELDSPQPVQKKTNVKDKLKKKKSSQQISAPGTAVQGKNEGTNPNWAYKPPEGSILLNNGDDDDLDWDALNKDDNLELWLIRVPDTVKSKYLNGLKVDLPSSSKCSKIGNITSKNAVHDLYSIGEGENDLIGGEELRDISCLVPRTPKPIARHIVVSAHESSVAQTQTGPHSATISQNPPRHSYPKDVLKHCFMPYGSRKADIQVGVSDGRSTGQEESLEKGAIPSDGNLKTSKSKKRKVESETPKRTKKAKTVS
ncbi:hypothetical protein SERLA73DRAFT_154727 [Serpula lacrymans var. lacrymans S7.3]|uniref:Uncharacterized protein n=1 Tax=Serpula lacrymans var. lacrymans (strain S7.3) TaxID=936435 RepID=F8Q5C9_SERL3|nr:hypothetical protein SERLA73DRAFT_154727 [Serpula lacrymans var. lacrymans S7.3]